MILLYFGFIMSMNWVIWWLVSNQFICLYFDEYYLYVLKVEFVEDYDDRNVLYVL